MTDIKEGFKQTEIGIIPEEWEIDTFENICVEKGLVRGPFGGALKKSYFVDSGYKVYEQKNAIYKSTKLGQYYINEEKYEELKRFAVKKGDFIVSCSGTIGRIFQIPEDYEEGLINQALLKITTDPHVIDDQFFYQYFEFDKFQKRIIDSTQGGAMKNLVGMPIIKKTLFPLPSKDEQNHIAKILNSIDDHVSKMDIIICEYERLYEGLIHTLFTKGIGHTDYKESKVGNIPEKWNVKKLGDCFDFYGGYSASRAELTDEGSLYLHYGDIHLGTRTFINTDEDSSWMPRYKVSKEKKGATLETGDIVLADASEDYEGVGKAVVIIKGKESIVAGLHTLIAKEKKDEFDLIYKRFFLKARYVQKQLRRLATGAKVYGISKGNIGEILIAIPDIEEQKIIGKTLANIERHIETLNQEKSEAILLKKALMDRLLTGKIRVHDLEVQI